MRCPITILGKLIVLKRPEMSQDVTYFRADLGLTMNDVIRINDRLKAAAVPVRVRLKGTNLALRATLPKKPEHGTGQAQYDISLKIPQTKDGLKWAEREAHKLAQRMAEGSFEWLSNLLIALIDCNS
jgi:hypothetical protein